MRLENWTTRFSGMVKYSLGFFVTSLTLVTLISFNVFATGQVLPTGTPMAHDSKGDAETNKQYVVMISLDGFRHDYIELHKAKHLNAIAKQGVRAVSMTPVYPSNTFPNHLSLVTGLLPKNHGIVNNRFYDKSRPKKEGFARYELGDGGADSTWIKATPLWNNNVSSL